MTQIEFPDQSFFDVNAEQYLLGSIMLLGSKALDVVSVQLRLAPEHFYYGFHGQAYETLLDLHKAGRTIGWEVLTYALEERGLKSIGDRTTAARIELFALAPDANNYREYAERIKTLARWRRRMTKIYERLEAISTLDEEAFKDADAVDEGTSTAHDGLLTADRLFDDWSDWYEKKETTIATPWPAITQGMFGGFRPGDTTVLAGHSGMGKSTAGDQILEVAGGQGFPGCAYLNEMSHIDRVSRQLAARAGVSFRRIMEKKLSPDELRRTMMASQDLPFAMQPCAGWSVDAICGHLRTHRWGMAFIDLATRIPNRSGGTAEWDYISGAIADAARQSGTHVILSVQLNRERNSSAARPMPVLRDLRNTGAWEADHRNVMFVHRREELDRDTDVPVLYDDGVIQLAKVSNGQQGAAQRVFLNYSRMRFELLAGEPEPKDPYA